MSANNYLIIDWGTTNFRAFLMSGEHVKLDQIERPMGLLQVPNGDFSKSLEDLLASWLGDFKDLDIYMAGMVGTAKGWHKVDYVATPASGSDLWQKAFSFALPWGAQATIFPGVSHLFSAVDKEYDVMRGEEVQLFGLIEKTQNQKFTAILPGTHSKHAKVAAGEISQFSSFLTGEFYAILSQHSLLAKGLKPSNTLAPERFISGVKAGLKGKLTNRVFLTWTHRLFANIDDDTALDYLSGLLIGYELSELKAEKVYIVGGSGLSARYQLALEHLNIQSHIVSGDECFLAGMTHLIKEH